MRLSISFALVLSIVLPFARAEEAPPKLSRIAPIVVTPRDSLDQAVTVEGSAPIELSVTGLPPGLAFDADKGRITGSLKEPGTYRIEVGAKNAAGADSSLIRVQCVLDQKYDTNVKNPLVDQNAFLLDKQEDRPLPKFSESRALLPEPFWDGRQAVIDCYWKAWEIAFGNLRQPPRNTPLVSNYIDAAFNGCTFLWDSVFMTMFGRYGERAFDFQGTLNNFYACQHPNGFIAREIDGGSGEDKFETFALSSTGPNVLGWAEWDFYRLTGDKTRLARVFPVLRAYGDWMRKYRTWQDGSYWSTGLGCGMDNQPRQPGGYDEWHENGHMSWIDATLQAILADKIIIAMAGELGRDADVGVEKEEVENLTRLVNDTMWNPSTAFYFDKYRDGAQSKLKSIGAYWALLAGTVPSSGMKEFLAHLENPAEFNRPHRVPTLSADDPSYDRDGGYWRGSIWAPTNYMVLRGLTQAGEDRLAHEIALNDVANVTKVFQDTGTLWENYAPEEAKPGNNSRKDFVGWTGLPPISILFEYVFGLRPDVPHRQLLWDVRLLDAHGVKRYPFGKTGLLDLRCERRSSPGEAPQITASTNEPLDLLVRWEGGERTIPLRPAQ